MITIRALSYAVAVSLLLSLSVKTLVAEPPIMLFQDVGALDEEAPSGRRSSLGIMRLPNNGFAFYDQLRTGTDSIQLPDRSGKLHSLSPVIPVEFRDEELKKARILSNAQCIVTPRNKLLGIFIQKEEIPKDKMAKVGLPVYLNVWLSEAIPKNPNRNGQDSKPEWLVSESRLVWRGYNGSQMEYQQLPSGRVLVPFGSYQPHAKAIPPFGRHKVVIQYSDDQGLTWTESESKLVSPCYPNFNGSNEGACEPAIEQLNDGRIWMLFRTAAGFLYESFSHDEGKTWTPAAASRFSTSTGPPNILRYQDGSLVVCWNNCEMPPRANQIGVYGGRDALHIAVSHDDGKSWRGFREIYLDHRRNDNPEKTGDRGTAYPLAAYTSDEKIVVIAGQGTGGRNPILVDPDWVVENSAHTDFLNGLDDWSTYKHYGPAKSWWRARAVGGVLVDQPDQASQKCLHLRKPDDLPPDGAVWNFPNGWSGKLTTRIWLNEGGQGGSLSLNDRFFDPSNDEGERLAVCRFDFSAAEESERLASGGWHDLRIEWNLSTREIKLFLDGKFAKNLPILHSTLNGISYVRLRSRATEIDSAGFLVDNVNVEITDPYAPPTTSEQQKSHEETYVQEVVKRWK